MTVFYQFGKKFVEAAKINLENGKTFEIEVKNQSDKNVFVKSISLNGKPLRNYTINHSQITNGGKMIFTMSNKYN